MRREAGQRAAGIGGWWDWNGLCVAESQGQGRACLMSELYIMSIFIFTKPFLKGTL